MIDVFIDGDFPTDAECRYHCSPTCHPGQVGEGWRYGCLHRAFPQNRAGDFCPLVECNGELARCEISERLLKRMIVGKKRKVSNAYAKARTVEEELKELEGMLKLKGI